MNNQLRLSAHQSDYMVDSEQAAYNELKKGAKLHSNEALISPTKIKSNLSSMSSTSSSPISLKKEEQEIKSKKHKKEQKCEQDDHQKSLLQQLSLSYIQHQQQLKQDESDLDSDEVDV